MFPSDKCRNLATRDITVPSNTWCYRT